MGNAACSEFVMPSWNLRSRKTATLLLNIPVINSTKCLEIKGVFGLEERLWREKLLREYEKREKKCEIEWILCIVWYKRKMKEIEKKEVLIIFYSTKIPLLF